MRIFLSLPPASDRVWIAGLVYGHSAAAVLRCLATTHRAHQTDERHPDLYTGLTGATLAHALSKTEAAVRQIVYRFRRRAVRDFADVLEADIHETTIVENPRDWSGYRLNPNVIQVIDWADVTSLGVTRDIAPTNHEQTRSSIDEL